MSDKEKKDKQEDGKKRMPFSVLFSIFMLLVTAAIFLPLTLVFAVCMVPTLVAAIVDSHAEKTAWLTVGAMNFVGTVPAWFALWDTGHTLAQALQMMTQPTTLMIAYGGAGVGWIFYTYVPPVIALAIVNKNERRLKDIDKRQKALVKKWGSGVAS